MFKNRSLLQKSNEPSRLSPNKYTPVKPLNPRSSMKPKHNLRMRNLDLSKSKTRLDETSVKSKFGFNNF